MNSRDRKTTRKPTESVAIVCIAERSSESVGGADVSGRRPARDMAVGGIRLWRSIAQVDR